MDNNTSERNFFGFGFKKKKETAAQQEKKKSFVEKDNELDGITTSGAGHYSAGISLGTETKNENDLISKYRNAAEHPEVDDAIDDIINEAVIEDETGNIVEIVLDDVDISDSVKNTIQEEFEEVLRLLNFKNLSYDIFRKWYVDARLPYHKVINEKNPKDGILELRYIDPLKIKKVRKKITEKDPGTGADIVKGIEEFYVYQDKGFVQAGGESVTSGIKIHPDSITYITSGLNNAGKTRIISHLHKALKPINQLSMLESSLVIYRIARAPERRAFYVDVGNLPAGKATEYMNNVMNKYRNKIVYDANSGEIKDSSDHMSIMDDFWLPRREGSRGTEIDTLSGGTNLGDIEDILYFRKKVMKALKVPMSRQEQENQFSFGRSGEITRDELKFQKFINRLRKRFSLLFYDILKTQLILKGLVSEDEWELWKGDITFRYAKDNHYSELKEIEVLRERLSILQEIEPFVGTFFSSEFIKKNILQQTDEEIKEIQKQISRDGDDKDLEGFEEGIKLTGEDLKELADVDVKEALANYLRR